MKKLLFPYNKKENLAAKKLVICFHHAGGSGAAFQKWMGYNGGDIEFMPLELPGHGFRRKEESIKKFKATIENVSSEISSLLKGREYVLFGHSMGAAMAFAVEYKLENEYGLKANKIIVAGRFSPVIEDPGDFRVAMGDEALVKEILRLDSKNAEIYNNEELLNFFMPIIKNDYELHEDFVYSGEKIEASIIAHTGQDDYESSYKYMNSWNEVTNGLFKIVEYEGGHFFPHHLGNKYIEDIIEEVNRHEMD